MVVLYMSFWLLCAASVFALATCGNVPTKSELPTDTARVWGRVFTLNTNAPDALRVLLAGVKISTTGRFDDKEVVATTDPYGGYSFQLRVNRPVVIMVYAWEEGYTKRLEKDKTWGYYGPATVRVAPGEETQADLVIDLAAWGVE